MSSLDDNTTEYLLMRSPARHTRTYIQIRPVELDPKVGVEGLIVLVELE